MRSARLIAYVLAVAAVAVAATTAVFYFAVAVTQVGVLCSLIAMALIAGARPVRLAGLRTELTATHPAALCALAALGPAPAVATSLAGLIRSDGCSAPTRISVAAHAELRHAAAFDGRGGMDLREPGWCAGQ